MDGNKPIKVAGIEIPAEEQTPLVERLLQVIAQQGEEIRQLREEIARLKGLPRRPVIRPSTLNQPHPDPSRRKKRRGKRPGSAKRQKTAELTIHETIPLPLEGLPEGTRRNGHEDYVVQGLLIQAHNICYQRFRYLLPDGSCLTAPLPAQVQGHFSSGLKAHVIYQYHQNHVTQPLIHEELVELGVDISAGQVNEILTEGHEAFHEEKDTLLSAAREVSEYFHTDDTGARHRGKNAYTNVIGNPLFASFTTTESKSRVNFLKLLRVPYEEYVVDEDALAYMKGQGLSQKVLARLAAATKKGPRIIAGDAAWQRQLRQWGIAGEKPQQIVTEGALVGTLLHHELYLQQPLLSDDAGQFDIPGFLHGLCWLHAERPLRKLLAFNPREQEALERIRDDVWNYYRRLRAYRESPTDQEKARLKRDFKELFTRRTGFHDLNEALQRIHDKREELLLVLDHPEIPLHNNGAEGDIREWAKKRKISAGTRSDLGRRCRDTFVSLKKTCRKLGVSFWRYLQDRIFGTHEILPLSELMRQAAQEA
jgi:hypothetical protein